MQTLSAFSLEISSGNSMLTWKNVEKESVMMTLPGLFPGTANRTLLPDSWTGAPSPVRRFHLALVMREARRKQ